MNATTTVTAEQELRMDEVDHAELERVEGGFFFLVLAGAALMGGCAGSLHNSPARDTLRAFRPR